jgi:hypothetical protein
MEKMKIWTCKIGEIEDGIMPAGADLPMRHAVDAAYFLLTGRSPDFIFSGWGGQLTPMERAVSENRHPTDEEYRPVELRNRLKKFYAVDTDDAMVEAMLHHIEKLQEQLPSDRHPLITQVRA